MFHDLDSTIENFLTNFLQAADTPDRLKDALKDAELSFEAPKSGFSPDRDTVNFFLYQTQENLGLRDPAPVYERIGDQWRRRPAPLRVDCAYMVTAWSNKVGAEQPRQEHRLLGAALEWLGGVKSISKTNLVGTVKSTYEKLKFPVAIAVGREDDGKNLGEYWAALGSAPRPSFKVVVTLAMEAGLPRVEGRAVSNARLDPGIKKPDKKELITDPASERTFRVGGRVFVRVAAGERTPVQGASVRIVERNRVAVTKAGGVFQFRRVPPGNYTLEVTHEGNVQEESINVPPLSGPATSYDVEIDA